MELYKADILRAGEVIDYIDQLRDMPDSAGHFVSTNRAAAEVTCINIENHTAAPVLVEEAHDVEGVRAGADAAAFYSDYICAFVNGRIAAFGTVEEVMTKDTLHGIYNVDFEILTVQGKPLSLYY